MHIWTMKKDWMAGPIWYTRSMAESATTAACSDRKTKGNRKGTVFFCKTCNRITGLHPGGCFERYHTLPKYCWKTWKHSEISKKEKKDFQQLFLHSCCFLLCCGAKLVKQSQAQTVAKWVKVSNHKKLNALLNSGTTYRSFTQQWMPPGGDAVHGISNPLSVQITMSRSDT